ncbi:MAG: InlB B-repeat-containing protein [Treponema sp.]|nr:InlB B-repeat-containing protein [Treponema sp.]
MTADDGYELESLSVTGVDGTAITVTNGSFTMPSQNVTVSASFKLITYTVTFNTNDGSERPATRIQNFPAGSAQALTTAAALDFSKTHYDFLGWASTSDATSATYTDGAHYTATADITLYAVWKIDEVFGTPLTLEFTGVKKV